MTATRDDTAVLAPSSIGARQDANHVDRQAQVIAALLCLAGMGGVYLLAVCTTAGQIVDTAVMSATATWLSEVQWLQAVLNLVSPLSVALGTLVIAIAGYAGYGRATAARAVGAVAVIVSGAQLLKLSLTRPDLLDTMSNSWPSGHVAVVAALSVGAVLVVPPTLRRGAALGGGIAVAITGLATMAQGWHRPSDVVGAALLAAAVALFFGLPAGRSQRMTATGHSER